MSATVSARKSAAFYATASDAIVQYARTHACLPAFPSDVYPFMLPGTGTEHAMPIARVLASSAVAGDVLPRRTDAHDLCLTLLPFEDFHDVRDDEIRHALVTKRARFVRLLARLANARDFAFHTDVDRGTVETSDNHAATSFWLTLLRALAPDAEGDKTKGLEQKLAALRYGGKLRILFSMELNMTRNGVASLLQDFFNALASEQVETDSDDHEYAHVLQTCGLMEQTVSQKAPRIEIGLEVLAGKVSPAVMTAIVDGLESLNNLTMFRASYLRFGSECPFATKAAELFGARLASLALDTLQLGRTRDTRPILLLPTLTAASMTVRRLVASDRDSSIASVASTLRSGRPTHTEVLDLECCANLDLATWLAFAVFHVDSPSRVSSLCLRMPRESPLLTREWLDHFKDALRSVRVPSIKATGTQGDDGPRVRHFVKLAVNTTVRFVPYEGKKTVMKLSEADARIEFERLVTDDDSDKATEIAVLISGVGVGWAPTKAVLHERTEPSRVNNNTPTTTNGRVTSFTWWRSAGSSSFARASSYPDHGDVLVELLSIIGEPLERLALPDMALSNAHVAQILRYCPNLKALNLSDNQLCNLTPLMEATANGLCTKLTSLSLLQRYAPVSGTAIATQLQDWLTSTAQSPLRLEQLAVQVLSSFPTMEERAAIDEAYLLPLIATVQSSKSLVYAELCLSAMSKCVQAAVAADGPSEQYVQLPMRSKLALLSVVHATHGNGGVGQLDASVLGLIFRFSRRTKIVLVTTFNK